MRIFKLAMRRASFAEHHSVAFFDDHGKNRSDPHRDA